jgi:hypothetical protein
VISLIDNFEPEPNKPGMPVPAADIEFWKDVFSVLLPPEEESIEEEED